MLQIVGGCPGNLLGISRILENKTIDEVIEAFCGVRCGGNTSRPDEISKALQQYKKMRIGGDDMQELRNFIK